MKFAEDLLAKPADFTLALAPCNKDGDGKGLLQDLAKAILRNTGSQWHRFKVLIDKLSANVHPAEVVVEGDGGGGGELAAKKAKTAACRFQQLQQHHQQVFINVADAEVSNVMRMISLILLQMLTHPGIKN